MSQAYYRPISGLFLGLYQTFLRPISCINQIQIKYKCIYKAYLNHIKGILYYISNISQSYLNRQSQQNIIHFILIRLFITFIDTEIFAAYAGSCLFDMSTPSLRKVDDGEKKREKKEEKK